MEMIKITLISLILSTTFSSKYFTGLRYNNRDDAQRYCQALGTTLATISTVTDNHDARNICTDNNGCWIGLTGIGCIKHLHACANYGWDDYSKLSSYGFDVTITGNPTNNYIQNAWISTDGPWYPEGFTPVNGKSCVYIDDSMASNSAAYNEIWMLSACSGATMRSALCNMGSIPPVTLFYTEMITVEDVNNWIQMPIASDQIFELPIITNVNRCWYVNDPEYVTEKWAGSKVLQGCWAIKTTSDNTARNSLARFQSTVGFEQCQVQICMDPWGAQEPACLLEYTVNGNDWITWHSFSSNDAHTFYINLPKEAEQNPNFGVRITLDENIDNNAECYFSNFYFRCWQVYN